VQSPRINNIVSIDSNVERKFPPLVYIKITFELVGARESVRISKQSKIAECVMRIIKEYKDPTMSNRAALSVIGNLRKSDIAVKERMHENVT